MVNPDEIVSLDVTKNEAAEIAVALATLALQVAANERGSARWRRLLLLRDLVRKIDRLVRARS